MVVNAARRCTYKSGPVQEIELSQSRKLPFLETNDIEREKKGDMSDKYVYTTIHDSNNTEQIPKSTALVGVCMFFFDRTTTMAEFAMRVMRMKNGAIVPSSTNQLLTLSLRIVNNR